MKIMNVRAHIHVTGRVQGVFFRVQTRHEAKKRNVTGWVRNTSDGRVEAVFEGKLENVQKLIDFCRIGPFNAKVTKIDIQWEKYTGQFADFKILRTIFL
jgi:acylphosphatase